MAAVTPEIFVEIAFSGPTTGTALHLDDPTRGRLDTATLAGGDLFVDVTPWVQRVATRRGATRADGPMLRYEGGAATIVLRNDDRRFDPTNLGGPYVVAGETQVEPMRAVRVRAVWEGVTYPLWRGYADDWRVEYDGPQSSVVTLTCVDALAVFASHERGESAAVGAGETTGARIGRILDSVGWPAGDREIAAGDSTVQATTLAGNALAELQVTADSEVGEFYVDASGHVVFRNRHALLGDPRSVLPAALFGDQLDETTAATVNYATNPSAETDLTGWSAAGTAPPALAPSTTRAVAGSRSLLVTWATDVDLTAQAVYTVTGLAPGRVYTVSAYVWVPAGSISLSLVAQETAQTGTLGITDQWVRVWWTGWVDSPTLAVALVPEGFAAAGQQAWVDALQIEEGDGATDYVDGDAAGCRWDGLPHASTSRRLVELAYTDVRLSYDRASIYNQISIAREGGTPQTVEDAASRTAYLTRGFSRSDLLLESDTAAHDCAAYLLHLAARPELRFTDLLVQDVDDGRTWPHILGREIGDRVAVRRRPPGGGLIERDVFVRGIEHERTADHSWRAVLVLESATRSRFFVLDHPDLGALDSGALAY